MEDDEWSFFSVYLFFGWTINWIIFRKDIKQGELIVADTPLFLVPPDAHSQNKNKVK